MLINGASYNTANDPYARVCVPNKVKNMNVKVFNLMTCRWNKVHSST